MLTGELIKPPAFIAIRAKATNTLISLSVSLVFFFIFVIYTFKIIPLLF